MNKVIQPLSKRITDHIADALWHIRVRQDPCADRIVHVMVDIRDLIRHPDDLTFQCRWHTARLVITDSITHFICQVQSLSVLFQYLNSTNTLLTMYKSQRTDAVQCSLACMSEWRMPQIMSKRDRLYQIFIQPKCLCNGTCILGNLQRMRHTCTVMVTFRCQEYLCLIFQTPEGLGMQNPVSVPLKNRTDIALFFLALPAL